MECVGKRVLVVGLGKSGRSAAGFLLARGAQVHGVDRNAETLALDPEIQALCRAGLTMGLDREEEGRGSWHLLLLSPGISPAHPLVKAAGRAGLPVIGEVELGCQMAPNPMWGITGTNGKTTVAMLSAHALNLSGVPAVALGNIGVPLTRELLTLCPEKVVVLELSSYQLETLRHPCLQGALLLNLTPDHLERHGTMEAYAQAKCSIVHCLKKGGCLYVEEASALRCAHLLDPHRIRLYGYGKEAFIRTDLQHVFRAGRAEFELPEPLKNKKSHDLENLLAAYALCAERGLSGAAFIEAWRSFKKPAHRIEFVAEQAGVRYYDDSKGTNVDAVIRAVQSLEGPLILIAGGVDKGFSYLPWLESFGNKVKLICAIGEAAAKLEDQLGAYIPVRKCFSLSEAVERAAQAAVRGDSVLLSPGGSSFDMFKDYVHRGEEFQRLVREWVAKCEL